MIKIILALLAALPEIIKLIKMIQDSIDEQAEDKKVKDELAKLNKAYKDKDAEAFRNVFNH